MQVTATANAGSAWSQTYTITQTPGGPPVDLTGWTFELVIRPSSSDLTSPALVQVTSAQSSAQGSITITPETGTVAVVLTPAATMILGQGARPYALWSGPGTDAATVWVDGTIVSRLVPVP